MRVSDDGLTNSVICVMGGFGAPVKQVATGLYEAASNQEQNDTSCLVSPSDYAKEGVPDDVAWTATVTKVKNTVISGLAKSMHDSNSIHTTVVYHTFDLKQRKEVRSVCMDYGKSMVAVFVTSTLEQAEKAAHELGIPDESAIRLYRKAVKPSPLEGWSHIYRYCNGKLTLMWDRVSGSKSDKLNWEKAE